MDDIKTLAEIPSTLDKVNRRPVFHEKTDQGWIATDWSSLELASRKLSGLLASRGVGAKHTVGLIGPSGPNWLMADLGIQKLRAVTVPMFVQLSPEVFRFEIKDAKIEHLILIGDEAAQALDCPELEFKSLILIQCKKEVAFSNTVVFKGLQDEQAPLDNAVSAPEPDDLATIIYTSGSTGMPKGVELTHRNLSSQICSCFVRFKLDASKDIVLSCLPLAHIFERMIMYFYICNGLNIYFVRDTNELGEDMKTVRPTIMTIVPRILEKVHAKIKEKIENSSGIKKALGGWAFRLAESNEDTATTKPLAWKIANRLVYKNMKQAFGGRLDKAISGGAALDVNLNHFYVNIGVPVYQGYGLTETAPVLACNFPGNNEPGTVGLPFPGVEVRISEEGEIIARGPNIMKGYHNRSDATSETIRDGWLHTGDKGTFNEAGRLRITGRIKELFKTSVGKYVSPVPIEQSLNRHPLIDMSMVIAEGRKFVSCLLFPDALKVTEFGQNHHLPDDIKSITEHEQFTREIDRLIASINENLNDWEKIQKYRCVTDTVSIQGGELTPTMKIKRHNISEKYKLLIDDIYN